MELRRIYPDSESLTPDEAASGLRLGELAPEGRPYLVLNMVSTADGRATIGGHSGPIGNEADRQLFRHLRTQADAVMVGAGTVRTERYGRVGRNPELRAKREREGLDPDPLAVLVSARLRLPPDLPILQDPDSKVAIITSSDAELEGVRAQVEYLRADPGERGPGPELLLGPMLARLRRERGVRSVLCEGGPRLNADLLREGLVDELFLCLAPKLAGDVDPLTIVSGPPLAEPMGLGLVWVLESEGHLFLRYRTAR